jgi:hypothetical protein
MTAFSRASGCSTRLFGTRGELADDGQAIRVYDFLTRAEQLTTPAGILRSGLVDLQDAFDLDGQCWRDATAYRASGGPVGASSSARRC